MGFNSERSLFRKKESNTTYVDHCLMIAVAREVQHRTTYDATGRRFARCHRAAEVLCRDNKTLERFQRLSTESDIQRKIILNMYLQKVTFKEM